MSTDKQYREQQLASHWNYKFKDSMVHKADYTKRWNEYWEAYHGEYFKKKKLPEYKSNFVANYVFSIIETIRPIMLDNDPKFQAMPRQPEGMAFANDLQEVFSYEWDREKMNKKLYRELITMLVTGSAVFFNPWNSQDKVINAIPVNPLNIFPDPLATGVDDAGYIIYARYMNDQRLKKMFPDKADRLNGGNVNYGELVYDNDRNARVDNQVLVLEVWTKGYESFEEQETGKIRVITLCPELGIVLSDKDSPYNDDKFPFVVFKDYEIPGKFWGEGEVAQLLSPQQHLNELNNAIIDNAKTTANMPWIVDKNSGIAQGKITGRPGLVIRKNPGSEVRREQPPSMPGYVQQAVDGFKADMEQVSGIFDTLKGNSETGVYTAQGILALQEAGQARIRLKVKLMEDSLSDLAKMWFSRIKQFWKDDRWLRMTYADGSYDFKMIKKDNLQQEYDLKITAGSTMPVNRGAMLDLMIRLAQTQMPDGQMLVDREAVVQYLPEEVKSAVLRRMGEKEQAIEQQLAELQQMVEQTTQQLQEVAQQTESNDGETMGVIEELASTLEKVNEKILLIEQQSAKMEEDKKKEDELNQIKNTSYNEGYMDAESLLAQDESLAEDMGDGTVKDDVLPDDILSGLETMTDDQLELIAMQNPELLELLQGAEQPL